MTTGTDTFTALPQADQAAVGTTLGALQAGFAERDADKLADVYSADADWVNAFGTVRKGRDEIVAHLRGLFADDNFDAGRVTGPPEIGIRALTDDVVLFSVHLTIEGQGLVDGGVLDRDNYSLHVLHRQPDGRWLVVSEMYSDANRETTYVQRP